ncbi:MAG: helix-turn-helix domain-containing protein [Acidobacteriia bacterium]|nr:helix-turn-helix domain-containing protein [Terriglobia bacterium]
MLLDATLCSRARRTRDPRFDGRFFIGVMTTRIYCRPVCPARSPKEENIRYFPTAAAAAEAGLRPCLRCRPECSPGTPGWLGTSATVSRALRLISESALEDGDGGMDALAERLGIGSRHLRRLFLQHLGASPITVAQTRRLQFAKKLIDESHLPMGEVALASGFGSVRRFNATFQKTYGRTPTHLRKLARKSEPLPENQYRFQLRFRPPFSWDGLLDFLAPRATPGVEVVEQGRYRRIISLQEHIGWIEAALDQAANAVSLRIHFPEPRWLFLIVEQVRRLFDLSADPNEIARHLGEDPMLADRVAGRPGLRVPGCWDGFELAVRAILGQQVTVRGATTLAGRLVRAFGTPVVVGHGLTHLFPTPQTLADADLTRIGLPRARAHCIRSLARAVCDGKIAFSGVVAVEEFLTSLRELPGIGDWTAQYVAMRALGEPDAFPSSDLGLFHATGIHHARKLEERAQAWRPWRAYAAMYLWQGVVNHDHVLHPHRKPGRAAAAGGGRKGFAAD